MSKEKSPPGRSKPAAPKPAKPVAPRPANEIPLRPVTNEIITELGNDRNVEKS